MNPTQLQDGTTYGSFLIISIIQILSILSSLLDDSPDITTSISRRKGNSVPSYLLAHKAHIRYRKRSKGKRQQSYQMRPDQQ